MNDKVESRSELDTLLHLTKMRKYKEGSPKKILVEILDIIEDKKHYGRMRNWELMVENLARWLVIHNQTGFACTPPLQGFKGLSLKKDELYDRLDSLDMLRHYVVAAKAKPWDYIGEVYERDLELTQPGQNMTPKTVVDFMTQAVHGSAEKYDAERFCYDSYREYLTQYYLTHHRPPNHLRHMAFPLHTQLDPCVGTGRFLLEASLMYPKASLVLFGIEINLSLYRACLVNMAMFSKHPYSIICADALMLDPNLSGPESKLWDLGNCWNPPDMSKFYWKPPPIRSDAFSLDAFTKLKKT